MEPGPVEPGPVEPGPVLLGFANVGGLGPRCVLLLTAVGGFGPPPPSDLPKERCCCFCCFGCTAEMAVEGGSSPMALNQSGWLLVDAGCLDDCAAAGGRGRRAVAPGPLAL